LPEIAYIALGSNVGDRAGHLAAARAQLSSLKGCRIVAESDIEETDALILDGSVQGRYLNQMVALETQLSPTELLDQLQQIEVAAGRERKGRWEPRTLDLDIVLFGSRTITSHELTVPHPELHNRDFWRRELTQIGGLDE
jgi:2-amino-4-hydroxy-6-hydroxymethyldihydropteridine diphosphokinase